MAGQLWAVNTLGGYFYSQRLSNMLREALQPSCKFRQFCDVKDETQSGKGRGDTFTYDIVFDVQTAGGTLTETNTIPETNFKIAQATGTLYEYGNSVPYTQKLEHLSQFAIRRPVMTALKNDAKKVLDSAAHAEFNKCLIRVVGTESGKNNWTFNGTATASNTSGLYLDNAKNIRDTMAERNIPYYDGDNYVCIAHPTTLRYVKDDLESVRQYTSEGFREAMSGEIGRYDNIRYVEQTGVAKTTWAQAKSTWAFFFGADTVCEGICVPEETRAKIPGDYGRSKGIAWYALLGFKIEHAWVAADDSGATQGRIVKWDTAG